MPSRFVISSMGSAFNIGSFRVVILNPCCVIDFPASDGAGEFGTRWPFSAIARGKELFRP